MTLPIPDSNGTTLLSNLNTELGSLQTQINNISSGGGSQFIKIPVGTSIASSTTVIPANSIIDSIATIIDTPYIMPQQVTKIYGDSGNYLAIDDLGNIYWNQNLWNYSNAGVDNFILTGNISNIIDISGYPGDISVGYPGDLYCLDTSGNIHHSNDNGATSTIVNNISNIIALAGEFGDFYALDNSGNVYHSNDGYTTYTQMGNVPNSIDISGGYNGDLYVLDTSGNIYASSDNGNTFNPLSANNIPSNIKAISSDSGILCVLDNSGNIYNNYYNNTFINIGNIPNAIDICGGIGTMTLVLVPNNIVYGTYENKFVNKTGIIGISSTLQVVVNGSIPITIQNGSQSITNYINTNEIRPFIPINYNNSGVVEVVVGNSQTSGSAIILVGYISTFLS